VACRLAENTNASVLLREAGSDDDVPAIRVRRKLALIVADAFGKIVAIGARHADRRA
jgi:hypothetical protein